MDERPANHLRLSSVSHDPSEMTLLSPLSICMSLMHLWWIKVLISTCSPSYQSKTEKYIRISANSCLLSAMALLLRPDSSIILWNIPENKRTVWQASHSCESSNETFEELLFRFAQSELTIIVGNNNIYNVLHHSSKFWAVNPSERLCIF